jgi:hypothetical protein
MTKHIENLLLNPFYFGKNDGSEIKSVTWDVINVSCGFVSSFSDCPKCNLKVEKLQWFKYRTNNISWHCLAGSEGYFSKCPKCNIYIQKIDTKCN